VCSVSCLYGLGSPADFEAMQARIVINGTLERDDLLRRLVDIQYARNDVAPERGSFRAMGDTLDIYPSYRDDFVRVEFWGDTIERLSRRDALTHAVVEELNEIAIFPAKHFVIPQDRISQAEQGILAELDEQVARFEREGRLVEAQRIFQRTMYDLEMLREIGYCQGIENYSRHLAGRKPGSRPYTLIDYFPEDFVTIVDESHVTLPQIHAMYTADRNRKLVLVEHGFRLPSALDNRPLNFEEYEALQRNILFVSATPGPYELGLSTPVEQVVRPTGLLDPEIEVRPLENQIDDVIHEIRARAAQGQRTLVTTLTKRTAEDLSDYLRNLEVRSRYLHSEVDAIERVDILRSLRAGDFDCLVGINLLREGLDLPEVSLVAVLDADKEGFLRSETSLMQTAGRAARHVNGKVILYADLLTDSMRQVIETTRERRARQEAFNRQHGITPRTVRRAIQSSLRRYEEAEETVAHVVAEAGADYNVVETVRQLEKEMFEAAEALEFERAAMLRDQIRTLQEKQAGGGADKAPAAAPPDRPRRRRQP
jgi:excinuclease ABC subunit B